MKRILKEKWQYIIAIVAGAALTPRAIEYAAELRGLRGRIGGEYLIIPLFFLAVYLFKNVFRTAREVLVGYEGRDTRGRKEQI